MLISFSPCYERINFVTIHETIVRIGQIHKTNNCASINTRRVRDIALKKDEYGLQMPGMELKCVKQLSQAHMILFMQLFIFKLLQFHFVYRNRSLASLALDWILGVIQTTDAWHGRPALHWPRQCWLQQRRCIRAHCTPWAIRASCQQLQWEWVPSTVTLRLLAWFFYL